jgi:hypothetical protein
MIKNTLAVLFNFFKARLLRMLATLLLLAPTLLLAACSPFERILYSPAQTPESWLRIQPYVDVQIAAWTVRIMQPSTSAIVYLLGLITIGAGVVYLREREGQRARLWWGVALLLWGLGAILAGTSYEAFSYELKCAGRAACIWTSWYELAYLVLSVASVDAMLVAQAYACLSGKWRWALMAYAGAHIALYTLAVLAGALLPVKFLISFELLLVVSVPGIVIFLVLNGLRYARLKKRMDLVLLGAWGWLILTIAAYFLYYLSGLGAALWARGVWFSENDVLHIGLIAWMLYLVWAARYVQDELPALRAAGQEV